MTILLPLFACMALGWGCSQWRLLPETLWPDVERLTYYLLLPAMLLSTLAAAPTVTAEGLPAVSMAGALISAVVGVTGLGLFLQARLRFDGPEFSSIFQGSMRPNIYVGLAAAAALFGQEGLTLSAVALLVMIPMVNLLCVPVVSFFGCRGDYGAGHIVLSILKNPLLLACAAGLGINLAGLPLPEPVFETIRLLGGAALPLGLMAVGAGLTIKELPRSWQPVLVSCLLKFVALPGLTWLACSLYRTPPRAAAICVLFAAVPAAASASVLARQLGGDDRLMAAIITGQTILAVATVPATIYLLG
ncbi:AEC family transporter [Megalodesulfovibrio gigas]|uniref:Putative auxin efflux carrier protein n=1 Tax=Megalodesulfovibrio gigas (strain ATCC 19364 / DSM 1382 / NCIMB 9332 / VKM B-1759) TaxID=1121448 RepID=T2G7H1_MEGG1|nr:AEC family transporter [Megalodesulfovibrio gigas]AGW12066.1 putative auxin efflux carrier protein [Megalodesulfovibrio gigas DSM 1382 = ATCC 19364]